MISKTTIEKRISRKTNPELVTTLIAIKRHAAWHSLGKKLSGSRREYLSVNLHEISSFAKEGDTIVVPGKVLGVGSLDKKVRISALGFARGVRDKIKESKSESVLIKEEITKNPKAQGVRIYEHRH